jgi:hypothetical protein
MRYFLISFFATMVVALIALFCSADDLKLTPDNSDGKSCPIKTLSPAEQILQDISVDATNITKGKNDAAAAQKALDLANGLIKTSTEKMAADRAKLNATLDDLVNPQPKPNPKTVQIVEVISDNCPFCDTPNMIKDFVASGINIITTKSNVWAANGTPTYIMTVDGKETQRVVGKCSKEKLQQWYNETVAWVNK